MAEDHDNRNPKQRRGVDAYRRATALQYDGQGAPVVTASGTDELAESIIALAREFEIPIYENPELAAMLAALELGDEIPHELYLIIAQIISLAYKIKGELPPTPGKPGS